MPTEPMPSSESLFLFAHQDDEFGVYHEIARRAATGRVHCVYLTDGMVNGDPARRDAESVAVLGKLGVPPQAITFHGVEHGIPDGRLHERLPVVAKLVRAALEHLPESAPVFVPAWEGGHPDHDGLHAVATSLLAERGQLARGRQYPLYNGRRLPGPLFRVLTPLVENGAAESSRLPWGERCRQLRHCASYPSQRRTWLGLLPFVAVRLLLAGRQSLQPLSRARIDERPHAGSLYYERRGFLTYEELRDALRSWLASRSD